MRGRTPLPSSWAGWEARTAGREGLRISRLKSGRRSPRERQPLEGRHQATNLVNMKTPATRAGVGTASSSPECILANQGQICFTNQRAWSTAHRDRGVDAESGRQTSGAHTIGPALLPTGCGRGFRLYGLRGG